MMRSLVPIISAFAVHTALVAEAAVPRYFQSDVMTRNSLTAAEVECELGSSLSNTTCIFGPESPLYPDATKRYSSFDPPDFQVVIEVGEESDIPKIVQYCNRDSIEWMLYNTGHGYTKTLGNFSGIAINTVHLRNITVQPDGKSAWFQGGVRDGDANTYLWDLGYVVTTGSCDCVGMMGAGLGGGHGRLEGLYGMVADNIMQLNVVLANGTAIVVNSTNHSDLLWAMKGAGHNFGIVTSFEMAIHPRGPDTWYYHNYLWTSDQLESAFNALNVLHGNGTTPVNMATNWGSIYMNSSVSTTDPIIWWAFAFRGSEKDAAPYFRPFDAIGAVYEESGNLPYPQISIPQQTDWQSSICTDEVLRIFSTAGLQVYNITAEKQLLASFVRQIKINPDLAKASVIAHEGYATAAVEAIDPATAAYPFREDHHLMAFGAGLPKNTSQDLIDAAWKWADEVRSIWNAGQPGRLPDAYVNYANGFETVEEWYGHEEWRIERLRALKAKYDPKNRFRFYNPII